MFGWCPNLEGQQKPYLRIHWKCWRSGWSQLKQAVQDLFNVYETQILDVLSRYHGYGAGRTKAVLGSNTGTGDDDFFYLIDIIVSSSCPNARPLVSVVAMAAETARLSCRLCSDFIGNLIYVLVKSAPSGSKSGVKAESNQL